MTRPSSRARRRAALVASAASATALALLTGAVGVTGATGATAPPEPSGAGTHSTAVGPPVSRAGWTGTWAAAVARPGTGTSQTGFVDTTLRQVAHTSTGGNRVRVRLSNTYGTAPLALGAVSVGLRTGPAGTPTVDADALRPLRFDGSRTATVPVGAELVSDAVSMDLPPGSDLVVSVHLPGPTGPTTWHPAGYATSFTAPGDATLDGGDDFTALDTSRYFLSGVDVRTAGGGVPRGSVVLFGDSITDGVDSTVDADLRYPDRVADRLGRRSPAEQCGVLNVGISGNRLLTDAGTAGDSALSRFDRDVLGRPGARSVVLLLGINDIGRSAGEVEPEQLIAVQRQFARRARDAGLTVVGATLTPYEGAGYYTEAGEADRRALNAWIRSAPIFDDVVDFDAALRDPADPGRMLPRYDVGDHLHPNDAGFGRMARAVDLDVVC